MKHPPQHPPHHGFGDDRRLHDGRSDGLEPLHPLDPEAIGSVDELLDAMSRTAFSGRKLGEAGALLFEMTRDREVFTVCTLSGAMTVAKMGLVVCRMIEWGMIDCIISTGALMAHGLSEAVGLTHYKVPSGAHDDDLFEKGYNRVYDTLEMEQNLNDVERFVRAALDRMPAGATLSSELFCREVGRLLSERAEGPGVLRSAFEHGVPVFVPAFTDSEIGLDVATWAMRREMETKGKDLDVFSVVPAFNPYQDLVSYARLVKDRPKLGIFTVGGGVPRNWAQQVAPFYDIIGLRLGVEMTPPRFRYGIRICPEPVHWGGLSGCTYSEGVSWGKFLPENEGGRYAEVFADATVAWPILVRGVIERLQKAGVGKRAAR